MGRWISAKLSNALMNIKVNTQESVPFVKDTMSFSFSDFYYIFVCCVEASK